MMDIVCPSCYVDGGKACTNKSKLNRKGGVKMGQLLVVVRHGHDSGDRLTDGGIEQVRNLRQIIWDHVSAVFGKDQKIKPLYFCFSDYKRALQTAQKLSSGHGGDIIITDLYLTRRHEIHEPERIIEKVMKLADCYGSPVIIIVAHGEMPAVLAETAYWWATAKSFLGQLRPTGQACGHIVDMSTGEITDIRFDSLDEKPKEPVVQKVMRISDPPMAPVAFALRTRESIASAEQENNGMRREGIKKMSEQKFGPPAVSSFDALERAIDEEDAVPF